MLHIAFQSFEIYLCQCYSLCFPPYKETEYLLQTEYSPSRTGQEKSYLLRQTRERTSEVIGLAQRRAEEADMVPGRRRRRRRRAGGSAGGGSVGPVRGGNDGRGRRVNVEYDEALGPQRRRWAAASEGGRGVRRRGRARRGGGRPRWGWIGELTGGSHANRDFISKLGWS